MSYEDPTGFPYAADKLGEIDAWGDDEPFPEPPVASPSYPTATTDRSTELATNICILCGNTFGEYGNNPEPLASYDDGRCCNDCNTTKVIPARLAQLAMHVDRPSWVLVVAERASDGDESLAGKYLASYDPDAYDGHGEATWTEDTDQALRFMKAGDALAFWRQQSSVKPVREDGRDNRPLTAYTMEVRNLAVPS